MNHLSARIFPAFLFIFFGGFMAAQPSGSDFWVRFPDDTLVYDCSASGIYGQPVVLGGDSGCIVVQYTDEIFPIILLESCIKIERIWTVFDSCAYAPGQPLVYIPNPFPAAPALNPLNFPGPVVSPCDATGAWAPTQTPASPNGAIINYCFYTSSPGYQYKQLIYWNDTVPPLLPGCPATAPVFIDSTINDPDFWNVALPTGTPATDLAETSANFELAGVDGCWGESLAAQFTLFLDLDADGAVETAVTAADAATPGWVRYGNAFTPGYSGGTPVAFDGRAVPANEKYRFVVRPPINLGWATQSAPYTYVVPQLPVGAHRLHWSVTDGCGNLATCEQAFIVEPVTTNTTPVPGRLTKALRVAPNPAAERATVFFGEDLPVGTATLVLHDALGRVARRLAISGTRFELERDGLPAGVYGLRLEGAGQAMAAGRVVFR